MEANLEIIEGRKYLVRRSPDGQQGAYIIAGPPEGLVDTLGFPEPIATRLHNILYERGIFTASDANKKAREIVGALQEAYLVDAQRLIEEFANIEKETA